MNCRVCGNETKLLHVLKNSPSSSQYLPNNIQQSKETIDLNVVQCLGCGLVQLDNNPVDYCVESIRSSSVSKEIMKFRKEQFKKFLIKYKPNSIMELGCNKGEYLNIFSNFYKDESSIVGFEKGDIENIKFNYRVHNEYIGDSNYRYEKVYSCASFVAFNYIEHLPDLKLFFEGVKNNTTNNAVGLIEVPNYDMILKDGMISEFVIDHLYYFTKKTLTTMLSINGFDVLNIKEILDGYVLSAEIRRRSEGVSCSEFEYMNYKLECLLNDIIVWSKKKMVSVYGAGHQSFYILSKLDKDTINIVSIIDDAKFKVGKYSPGSGIVIHDSERLKTGPWENILIIAGSYNNEIYNKIKNYKNIKSIAMIDHNELKIIKGK